MEQRQCGSLCDNCAVTWQHTATSGPPLYLGCPIGSAEPNPKVTCEHGSFPLSLSINLSSYFPSFAPAAVLSFCAPPFRAQRVHISDGIIYQLIQSFCSWSAGLVSVIPLYLSFSCHSDTPLISLTVFSTPPPFLLLENMKSQVTTHVHTHTLGHGLHEYTDVQGRIEAVSITTRTSSCFCHAIRKKLLQGSNLTEVFNWTNNKVILSFN